MTFILLLLKMKFLCYGFFVHLFLHEKKVFIIFVCNFQVHGNLIWTMLNFCMNLDSNRLKTQISLFFSLHIFGHFGTLESG